MNKLPNTKYPIPQEILTTAIEGLKELALRMELEAAAFAQVHSQDGAQRAEELLKEASAARKAHEYFLNL